MDENDRALALSARLSPIGRKGGSLNLTSDALRVLQLAKNGRNAVVLDRTVKYLQELAPFDCSLVIAVDKVVSVPIASIVFAKNSPLTEIFEKG